MERPVINRFSWCSYDDIWHLYTFVILGRTKPMFYRAPHVFFHHVVRQSDTFSWQIAINKCPVLSCQECLMGGLEHGFDFPYGIIIPTDELIVFKMVETTNQVSFFSGVDPTVPDFGAASGCGFAVRSDPAFLYGRWPRWLVFSSRMFVCPAISC